ncbi:MAG: hypothetical protein ACXQS7_06415 [Candidatus Syntropharchaeia archaeon]
MKNCANCGVEVPDEDVYEHEGKELCEDCYINATRTFSSCKTALATMAAEGSTKERISMRKG